MSRRAEVSGPGFDERWQETAAGAGGKTAAGPGRPTGQCCTWRPPVGGVDFFLDRIGRLSCGIRSRCLGLAAVEARSAYDKISRAFDDRLAGRCPFTLIPFQATCARVSPRGPRAFYDPWLSSSPTGNDAPVFDLSAGSRVNRKREVGGNRVIA